MLTYFFSFVKPDKKSSAFLKEVSETQMIFGHFDETVRLIWTVPLVFISGLCSRPAAAQGGSTAAETASAVPATAGRCGPRT